MEEGSSFYAVEAKCITLIVEAVVFPPLTGDDLNPPREAIYLRPRPGGMRMHQTQL